MIIVRWFKKNQAMFMLLIIVVIAFSFLLNVLFTIQLKYEKTALQEEIFELENRLLSSQQELEKTKTDIYIHQEATERLGLTKSDEIPVKITIVEEEEEATEGKDIEEKKLTTFLNEWYKDLTKMFKTTH